MTLTLQAVTLGGGQHTPVAALGPGDLTRIYVTGQTYDLFRADVRRRTEAWKKNSEEAAVDPALLARARAVTGTWRLLAVAVDSCSDSVSTLPYIARLAEQVDTLDMRLVGPTEGRAIMEAHRTPDDRAATPTVVLLDAGGALAGCWIERPAALNTWLGSGRANPTSGGDVSDKMGWYERDKGAETVREIVEMLESAAAGRVACPVGGR